MRLVMEAAATALPRPLQNDGCSTSYDVATSPDLRGSGTAFVGLNVYLLESDVADHLCEWLALVPIT